MKPILVATAILFCRPALPQSTALAYARIVVERAGKLGVDPLMIVAIADHESGWTEGAVSKDGEDRGLGQIRARYRAACAKDKDPLHAPSAGCAAEKKRLLDGEYNLGAVFEAIDGWIMFCEQKTGSAGETAWLTAYAGLNRPKTGTYCGARVVGGKAVILPTAKVVREFERRRRALRLRLEALPPGG